jgi:hypothetical protein
MSSMSHTSATNTIDGNCALEYKESPPCDNVGGVDGRNYTPSLINPPINMYLESKSQHLFVMKP